MTAIDRDLIKWSAWSNFDLAPVKVPKLDQEGVYKLIIEYKAKSNGETRKFEKLFYAYKIYLTNTSTANYDVPVKIDKETATTEPPTNKPNLKTNSQPVIEKRAEMISAADRLIAETRTSTDEREDLKNFKIKFDFIPEIISSDGNLSPGSSDKHATEMDIPPDYDQLLAEAVEKMDTVLLRESVQNGAGITLKGKNGGNIFHLLNETTPEDLISFLKNKGFSINETDNDGNSPLHFAILSGKRSVRPDSD